MKNAFFNVRYKDKGGQKPDQTPLWDVDERFEEKPVDYRSNYLYTDEFVDRWNSPPAGTYEQAGVPKGKVPGDGKEYKKLYEEDKRVFEPDVIRSLNKQDNMVEEIKKAMIGG